MDEKKWALLECPCGCGKYSIISPSGFDRATAVMLVNARGTLAALKVAEEYLAVDTLTGKPHPLDQVRAAIAAAEGRLQ